MSNPAPDITFNAASRRERQRRWALDAVLLGLLLFTMVGPVVGFAAHEWAGTAMMVLLVPHLPRLAKWRQHFSPGSFSTPRLRALLNIVLLVSFLVCIVSGIWISKRVFHFLPTHRSLFLRHLHTASSYWFFLLLGWHLCLHRKPFSARLRTWLRGRRGLRRLARPAAALIGVLVALTGIYLFVRWDIGHRLIMETRFGRAPRLDPLPFNILGHLLLLGLVLGIAYGGLRSWRAIRRWRLGSLRPVR